MNRFQKDLEYSLNLNESEAFDKFYREFFQNIKRIEAVSDIALQKQGIDKIVHLESGKKLLIDEKKRRKDYNDILIEEYSDYDSKVPGWLHRDKHTDYIAYAVIPSNKLYFLPFIILQKTVKRNYQRWLDLYGRIFANNNGYRTSNIPVPLNELFSEMEITMRENEFCNNPNLQN